VVTGATRHHVYCRYMPNIYTQPVTPVAIYEARAQVAAPISPAATTPSAQTLHRDISAFSTTSTTTRALTMIECLVPKEGALTPCKARWHDDSSDGIIRRGRTEQGCGGVEFESCGWERVGVEDLEQWLRMRMSVGRTSYAGEHG
jgi:hypothetical protein